MGHSMRYPFLSRVNNLSTGIPGYGVPPCSIKQENTPFCQHAIIYFKYLLVIKSACALSVHMGPPTSLQFYN